LRLQSEYKIDGETTVDDCNAFTALGQVGSFTEPAWSQPRRIRELRNRFRCL